MTSPVAHNPGAPPQWLLDLHPGTGVVYIRRRGREPVDGTEVVFEVRSRDIAAELRAPLCTLRIDRRYQLTKPMTATELRAVLGRAARRAA
jgi:hypothetical protein